MTPEPGTTLALLVEHAPTQVTAPVESIVKELFALSANVKAGGVRAAAGNTAAANIDTVIASLDTGVLRFMGSPDF
jgi:hypothetical protein